MVEYLINAALMVLLAMIAIFTLRAHRLFGVVMLSGAYSLVAAALFVVLDAVDVAFTEAAVGAGVSTVLAIATLSLVPKTEQPHKIAIMPLIISIITGGLLMIAVIDMPQFGDQNAPIHRHVAPDYFSGTAQDIGIPNVVTSVLASYRGYDTLGETVVVFTAAIATFLILAGWTRGKRKHKKSKISTPKDDNNV